MLKVAREDILTGRYLKKYNMPLKEALEKLEKVTMGARVPSDLAPVIVGSVSDEIVTMENNKVPKETLFTMVRNVKEASAFLFRIGKEQFEPYSYSSFLAKKVS